MLSHLVPATEARRLASLRTLHLLDGPREPLFNHLVKLTSALCATPIATLGLVDEKRVWFKAAQGLASWSGVPRWTSLCNHAVLTGQFVEVADAVLDPRCSESTLVMGAPFVRLYACAPLYDRDGLVLGVLSVMDTLARPLTGTQRNALLALAEHASTLLQHGEEQMQSIRRLRKSQALAQHAYRKTPSMRLALDLDGCIIDASDEWLQLMGYTRIQIMGVNVRDVLSPDAHNRFQVEMMPAIERDGWCTDVPLEFVALLGHSVNVRCIASSPLSAIHTSRCIYAQFFLPHPVSDTPAPCIKGAGIPYDGDAGRMVPLRESAFTLSEGAAITLKSIGDGVISTDLTGAVVYLNPVAEKLTGWTMAEALGQPAHLLLNIVNEFTRAPIDSPVQRCLSAGCVVGLPADSVLVPRHGQDVAIEDTAAPIRDSAGRLTGAVMVFHDVSEQRRLQREITHQSNHDALTGLVNRREFEVQLRLAVDSAAELRLVHAVCYIDLDQFKVVNDTSGHTAGDELLRQVSTLMREKIRKNDILARLGGDEFGVLLLNCPLEQAQQVAENIRRAVEDFRFLWQTFTFKVGASLGLVPLTRAVGSVECVLQAADKACYAAKESGRNRVHLYVPEDTDMVRRTGELSRVANLPAALEQGRFRLYAQEISPLQKGDHGILNIEILLRLKDLDGIIIEPGAFLPAAERYNCATTIDRWVVAKTLGWLADNAKFVREMGHCAINLSGQSMCDASFQQYVIDEIENSGLARGKICFEVTETAAIANLSRANKFMLALRERGCLLALDDFGSGLSSFGYLRNLPVDILKIDGMFVRGIVDDPVDQALVRSINCIGQLLGKSTVAECVENAGTLSMLKDLGVDYAQGYTLGRPEPIDDMASRW